MLLDKGSIIAYVRDVIRKISPADANDDAAINRALVVCLDNLSNRLRSSGMLVSAETTVASAARTASNLGDAAYVRYIFAVKIGSGNTEKVLTFSPMDVFIREHDSPAAESGTPEYYTVLADGTTGQPTIKFDRPLSESMTLKVYFHPELTPDNMALARSLAAVSDGTLAHFFGIATEVGKNFYESYKDQIQGMLAGDRWASGQERKLQMGKTFRNARSIQRTIRNNRL